MSNTPLASACPVEAARDFTFPNEKYACASAQEKVISYLQHFDFSPKVIFRIELVIEEAMMNQIWHAHPDDEEHQLGLRVSASAQGVELRFEDDGLAFNPLEAKAPVAPTTLDGAKPGGWGLVLIKKYAKAVSYQRQNNRNYFTVLITTD